MQHSQPIAYVRSIAIPRVIFFFGIFAGLCLVVAWSFTEKGSVYALRYLGEAVLFLLTFSFLAITLNYFKFLWSGVADYLGLALFVAYELVGALYTRVGLGSDESFFAHGLAALTFFLTYAFARRAGTIACSQNALWAIALLWPVMLSVVVYGFLTSQHLAHEIMYIFTPIPMYFALRKQTFAWKCIAMLCILAIGGLGLKNTTLITAGMATYLLWVFSNPRVRESGQRPFRLMSLAILLIVGLLFYGLWTELSAHVSDYSSGNTDFRTYNYGKLWHKFLGSPVYGDNFIGTPNLVFDLYQIDATIGTQNLPSHSDVLDILAHGGLIAAALFIWFIGSLIKNFLQTFQLKFNSDRYAEVCTLFTMTMCGFVTMAINPILGNMSNAFLLWMLAGLCGSLCERRDTVLHIHQPALHLPEVA